MTSQKLSPSSLARLQQCHPDLIRLIEEASKNSPEDILVVCGHRNKVDQDRAVSLGHSKVKWPKSKHNTTPAKAVDIVPYPVDWTDVNRFRKLMLHIEKTADILGIHIKLGRDFKKLVDWPHIELF